MNPVEPIQKKRLWKTMVVVCLALLLTYLLMAYVLLPAGWFWYETRHLALQSMPKITRTGNDIPGDPLNVAFIGTEVELKTMILAANWHAADPLTFRSCLEIAEASVLRRPYADAPVSNLYLFGRKEDLAFEQPVGNDPRRRHHVRLWRSQKVAEDGRPFWMGATTFDERVGVSHTTGQITHHISPDVDAERDKLLDDCEKTRMLSERYFEENFHTILKGKNGGGDPWQTDGRLGVGVIAPIAQSADQKSSNINKQKSE